MQGLNGGKGEKNKEKFGEYRNIQKQDSRKNASKTFPLR